MNKEEIEESINMFKESLLLITDEELRKIDNNFNYIIDEVVKSGIHDKELVIAQHVIDKQQRYIEQLENKVKEQDREKQELIEILKKDISACKSEIITVQNGRNRNELKGSERRRLASVSGRQNEAIRILNLIGGKNR